MNSNFELFIQKSKNAEGIPDYQLMLNYARDNLFKKWKQDDSTRANLTKFPRRIFSKDSQLKSQWEFIQNKVNMAYNECMTDLYYEWLETHQERPYLNSNNNYEVKLARWFSKQLRKGHPPQHILEQHRELPYNHAREYSEWRHVYRKYPSVHSKSARERRLAKWSIAVRLAYQKGELPEDQTQTITKVLGQEWLQNAPFLKLSTA